MPRTHEFMSPLMFLVAAGAIAVLLVVWWIRERRMRTQRQSMRVFHALSEQIISAASASEIAEKLVNVLPTVSHATAVRLYLFNRRTKSLERVPTKLEPAAMAVSIDSPRDGPASGAVACFRNRMPLDIPDLRRSPFVKADTIATVPRAAIFAPLIAQHSVLGVLEVSNSHRAGCFSLEEQAATQHLANQVAASLKLQEQKTMREQLFRSDKLAATGKLISGVAGELRAPLERILELATSLIADPGRATTEQDLRLLAAESQRASEIVSRLVSFARPEDSAERPIDINALVPSLMHFREPEWKALDLRVQNRLALEPALVLGVPGQLEQVFLNLLVHAEQCASQAPGKTIAVSSSVIARRVIVEIGYSTPVSDTDAKPMLDTFAECQVTGADQGLAVCHGIVQSHGGEIRFSAGAGTARFEIDLPEMQRAEETAAPGARKSTGLLTIMLVEPDSAGQRQLLSLLGTRGHRAVPVAPEEAADLAPRLRFDAVFWSVRPSGLRWGEFQESIRTHIPLFVLLSDGHDPELARSLEASGGFLLGRPVQESELDRILNVIDARIPNVSVRRS